MESKLLLYDPICRWSRTFIPLTTWSSTSRLLRPTRRMKGSSLVVASLMVLAVQLMPCHWSGKLCLFTVIEYVLYQKFLPKVRCNVKMYIWLAQFHLVHQTCSDRLVLFHKMNNHWATSSWRMVARHRCYTMSSTARQCWCLIIFLLLQCWLFTLKAVGLMQRID